MKRLLLVSAVVPGLLSSGAWAATTNITAWVPLFQGVDHSTATVRAEVAGERNLAINCLRIDLTDPDLQLLTTPKCTNCGNYETLAENTSHFLEQYGVQVAVNGMFYQSSSGPNDVPLGTTESIFGFAMSRGNLVSPQDLSTHAATLLLTTNKVPTFLPYNWPNQATTNGIYTAFTGNILLVTNGLNAGTNQINDLDPRTGIGLSEDSRFLYFMTIDGRQPGWSDGANFFTLGDWLIRFGAYNGFNVDGGGSTTMVMADCQGKAIRLNRSSFVAQYGRERIVGHNLGVYARPLPSPIRNLSVEPGSSTAIVTWNTDAPASTQVEYGSTTNYGSATPPDSRLVKTHIATLNGLQPGSNYYFRAVSVTGTESFAQECRFSTANNLLRTKVFDITNEWRFTTNGLDGTPWTTTGYDDSGWMGQGPGLLYSENNASVNPKNTLLPPGIVPAGTPFPRTYYFRTHFNNPGEAAGATLVFSNYLDDGAVYYLNGAEIHRLRMPAAPTVINNGTSATGSPSGGDATAAELFTVSDAGAGNLVSGDNVLAVEVHNYPPSADIVFGSALFIDRMGSTVPTLRISYSDDVATLYWNGAGFTLQQTTELSLNSSNVVDWVDMPGGMSNSPVAIPNSGTTFYRLRN